MCYFYHSKMRFPCFSHTRESINHSMFSTIRPERCVSFIYWPLSWASQMMSDPPQFGANLEAATIIICLFWCCQQFWRLYLPLCKNSRLHSFAILWLDVGAAGCDFRQCPLLSLELLDLFTLFQHICYHHFLVHRGPDEHLNIWSGS